MVLSYGKAINKALYDSLIIDPSVVVFGEDIQSNLYGYSEGLVDKFGTNRVINIPLSEASVMGLVCGSAMCGLHPVLDLTLPNFLYITMDQIANIIAKTHYMYNGAYTVPLTIFCSNMCGGGNAAQHSDRLHAMLMNIPGLIIICPSTPNDMYCMLREAIQNNNPVICFADRSVFWTEEEVELNIKSKIIGKAKIVQKGKDLTIVTVSGSIKMVKDIIPDIQALGISAEIIDIRSIIPLDFATISESVKKTGKVIICDTANRTGSVASEIASRLAQYSFFDLKAPIQIVACEDVPVPFANELEKEIVLTKEKIYRAIELFFS